MGLWSLLFVQDFGLPLELSRLLPHLIYEKAPILIPGYLWLLSREHLPSPFQFRALHENLPENKHGEGVRKKEQTRRTEMHVDDHRGTGGVMPF